MMGLENTSFGVGLHGMVINGNIGGGWQGRCRVGWCRE